MRLHTWVKVLALFWVICLGVLVGGLIGSSCQKAAASSSAPRIMVLGDSITVLCGNSPPGGYCAPLGGMLTSAGITPVFINHALGGATCKYSSDNIQSWLAADHPDLVLLSCGTNNVPGDQASQDALGTQFRIVVEAVHGYGARLGVSFIGYSNPDNGSNFHASLLTAEATANDVLYRNMQYYQPYGWFSGLADFQGMPGDLDYLISDGIHPTTLGYKTMAAVWYRSLRVSMGWPDITPQPCGLWGRRPGYSPPAFTGCVTTQ